MSTAERDGQRVSDEQLAEMIASGQSGIGADIVYPALSAWLDLHDSRAEAKRLREALQVALNAVDPAPGVVNLVTREEWIAKARAALGEKP